MNAAKSAGVSWRNVSVLAEQAPKWPAAFELEENKET
jgi:hypothetical protein